MLRCGMSFESILDYYEGRADEATAARVREHLADGCKTCQQQLARVAHTLDVLPELGRLPVPEQAMERARAIFRERFSMPERPSILAQLVFDSRTNLALAGARGEESASLQQHFRTDLHDIDLWQEATEEKAWYLIGQVISTQDDTILQPDAVLLRLPEGATQTARIEPREFHFDAVPEGSYEMIVQLGEVDITLPDVQVGK